MATAVLTPEQEAVAHKIDTLGLGLIGAGVAGGLMHQHGAPGGLMRAIGGKIHDAGPYLDLAGLSLIAPPVMNPLAKKLAPPKAEEVLGMDGTGTPVEPASPGVAIAPEDRIEEAKLASYQHGLYAAEYLFRTGP